MLRLREAAQPLDGVRILDMTRVLAGPSSTRTLASHGADVLSIRAEKLPAIEAFDLDTGYGKRSAYLDLTKPADAEKLRNLARNAHVFVDSYRPGALAGLGLTPASLAHLSPGIVYVSLSCYGHVRGPIALAGKSLLRRPQALRSIRAALLQPGRGERANLCPSSSRRRLAITFLDIWPRLARSPLF